MKKTKLLLFLFSSFSITVFAQDFGKFGIEFRGAEASAKIPGAKHIWIKNNNPIPAFIEFYQGAEPDEEGFLVWGRKAFGWKSDINYIITSREEDQIGFSHIRCQITSNGIPIKDGNFILHSQNGRIRKVNGLLFQDVKPKNTFSLAETDALKSALADIHATTYKWQVADEESHIKLETKNPAATYFPKGKLVIIQADRDVTSSDFRFAWQFDIYAQAPLSRDYIYVDAQDGSILRKDTRLHTADAPSTATTGYRGVQSIVSDSYTGGYRLREAGRGNGIRTFNLSKGTNYGTALDFTSATTTWNLTNANKDQYALDAHFGGEKTYDFFWNSFGRNSIDNAGFQLNMYIHYSTNYVNAFWDGTKMTFGDGNTSYSPLTSLDITGHEITHGLTEYTANLDYSYESGAMNEGFSDIFGVAIEYYATPTQSNWLMGEDIGTPFRSMSNPNAYGDPDTYTGTNWATGAADNGGVHTNSGVLNYWYYLLTMGGNGTNDKGNAFNVTAIGRTKSNAIAYRTLTNYLINTSQYADARFYALQSATDLYGGCSQEVTSTGNAWYAVGVGTIYTAAVDAQFVQSNTLGCSVPFTVNFTNQSTNGNSYIWYFGDGTTSTATSPSHTYTTFGTYTVKLVASGGTCGNDSIVKSNLVSLSSSNPCVVNMPTSGTAQTQTSCTGTVYDDGGQFGLYADNVNSIVTISPTGASRVQISFAKFRMESGYDYLYVYDGASTGSPILGTFTGNTLPASITSTGSSITIKEFTDPGVVDSGFAINWTCILPTTAPTANFSVSDTNTCSGVIAFTDKSTGGATAWLWDFGDATTSTLRNPTKKYLNNGTYTVKLTATNSFGSNMKTSTSLITVLKPAGPAVVNGNRCTIGSVSLSATSTNTINWYSNASDTSKISSTNPFATPSISSTTNYYAEEVVPQTIVKVGAASNTIGAGSIFNGNNLRALRFKVMKASRLVSVYVYAQGDGFRVVQYRDTFGTIIAQKNVFIPNGGSRITLNIDLLPSGTTIYELGVQDSMNLYRNTAGAAYPYNDSKGLVSIIGNNIPGGTTTGQAGYYYYFYDWEVQEPDCISLRSTATANISNVLNTTTASTNVNCFGDSTGTAIVTPSGAQPTILYQWNNGKNTATVSNLKAGTYTVSVTDGGGCSTTKSFTITQPASLPSATVTPTAVSCFGGTNGTASVTGSGGTASYTFAWTGGSTGTSISNLSSGNYTVTVTDSKGCTATKAFSVSQPTSLPTAIVTPTPVSCFGGTNGTAAATGSGGTAGYNFAWTGGATGTSISNLSSGNYTVTVTDTKGCSATKAFSVTQPSQVTSSMNSTNAGCSAATGSASINATGGTAGYSYLWSNGQTTSTITNLTAGSYSVTITDAKNCTSSNSTSVNSSALFSVSKSTVNNKCFGDNSGSASVSVNGGTPSYSYNWSNGGTNSSIANVAAGTYIVTTTDGSGCAKTDTIVITQPTSLSAITTSVNANCAANNGNATATTSGGTPTYSYVWNNGQTTGTATNLIAGNYSVTVKDANNCTTSASITVGANNTLTTSTYPSNVKCFNGNDGAITITANGGSGNYQYAWNNGSTTASLSNLSIGKYIVTISDGSACQKTDSFTITAPTAISTAMQSTNVLCANGNNGSATITATGGTPSYAYSWSNGDKTNTISNLAAGTYTLTVIDANGCVKTDSVIITENSAIVLTVSKTNSSGGQNNGTASVSTSGGTPSYSYAWSNGAQTAAVTGLAPGTYTLTVKDVYGCESQSTVTIESSTSITAIQDIYLHIYPNPANAIVYVELPDNIQVEQFQLTDVIGRIVNVETEYNNHRLMIRTASLAAAVYQISIQTNIGSIKQKLIVER
ncbi:MAG: M4 family metallopeptidase [Chitinophagales bacterium]|nr:M4 family metallopeptidase [Chitinophagales bacterium]